MIKIYGASDDLIEVEGQLSEEFDVDCLATTFVGISDGTLLRISYDGMWHINVARKPVDTVVKIHRATNEDDDYSDIAEIDNKVGDIDWLVVGRCA